MPTAISFPEPGSFATRHLGPSQDEEREMLAALGVETVADLVDEVVPDGIRLDRALDLPEALSEANALATLRRHAGQNELRRSFIGRGYYGTLTPAVIQRNVLENPGWYTAYTPYQAEISQGRLEALLNFQTMACDLTGLSVANASLLDEATAAAEAMAMCASARRKGRRFLVSSDTLDQTIEVLRTRAAPLGIDLVVENPEAWAFEDDDESLIGVLLSYPSEEGGLRDWSDLAARVHAAGGFVVVATDLLALTLLRPPGEWGADIAVGSAQRFGVPMGYGGPHAAFLSCTVKHQRRIPGRLIGVSKDSAGRPAYRLALQTREQHIRREKATSNICTAQVLLAVMAGLYAVYHGPDGLRRIASEVHETTTHFASALRAAGYELVNETWFDTLTIRVSAARRGEVLARCEQAGINLRIDRSETLGVSLDEVAVDSGDWRLLWDVFELGNPGGDVVGASASGLPESLRRTSAFLGAPVFHEHHTETGMMRYLRRLEGRDIALNWSMIPLGSCTMKLNAASEMLALSWDEIRHLHPFVPSTQAAGYDAMVEELGAWLAEITGFAAISFQPNAGSQGEYAGLLAIRRFHASRGDHLRSVCLIPMSAHGTNPASAVMAGFEVVSVRCDDEGNVDVDDIRRKAEEHAERLGALMITYPSTHGVFEEAVAEIAEIVHACGGQVYMDGANLNAQVGLCRPGDIGADVCHLNLHKTFCIPHGGGGPGVGPIGVASHLVPFLPGHRESPEASEGAVSAAPCGSASILTISWMYLAMMGGTQLTRATAIAILNANYIAKRLEEHYPVLYRGGKGRVAHECILDTRGFKETAGIDVEDIAKRLIDFGFHAPTMSWPVPGTLMIEPTESESKEELDRFCDAMIAIHGEIEEVRSGRVSAGDSPLRHAPHPAEDLLSGSWDRAYDRERAAYPVEWVRTRKYWPPVSRIDNVFGDRNLVCTCEGMETLFPDG